jgi:hypothetical protein
LNVRDPCPILISAFAACDKKNKEAKEERIIFLFIFIPLTIKLVIERTSIYILYRLKTLKQISDLCCLHDAICN